MRTLADPGWPAVERLARDPYRGVEDVLTGLVSLEADFLESGDRRGVFVTAYRIITSLLVDLLAEGRFEGSRAMSSYVTAFANAYRVALLADEEGRGHEVAPAWQISLDVSRAGTASVLQDLMLGINAHINHDLPFAILAAGLDTGCEACLRDHVRVNAALSRATPAVRHEVLGAWGRGFTLPARVGGRIVDRALFASFQRARAGSWEAARGLCGAVSKSTTVALARRIEAHAADIGRRMRAERRHPLRLVKLLGDTARG